MNIRVGDQEIGEELQEEMNAIVSEFCGKESAVTEIASPQFCRSSQKNQYRLTIDNKRHVSVKHAYSGRQDIGWEVFHSDIRQLLGLPHYKLERKNGFPIPGWENKECIIMDWGFVGRRQNIAEWCVQAEIRKDPASPIQLGQVAAQNVLFGTGDRKGEHIIWDLDKKVAFSIDHEIPATNVEQITNFFQRWLGAVYKEKWYDGSGQQNAFDGAFEEIWKRAHNNKDEILKFYRKEMLDEFSDGFSRRLSMGHAYFLQKMAY